MRGKFITFEGGEGAGKSTQIRSLATALQQRGLDVVVTREPGGSAGAEALRHVILSGAARDLGASAEAILFSAARIDHIDQLIEPNLAQGKWVLCDRFADSTRAYQGALGNLDPRLIQILEKVTLNGLKPDLTLMLDLDPKIGMARADARRGKAEAADRFESEGADFHKALRNVFLDIAAAEPERCVVIDASRSAGVVSKAIAKAVARHFELDDGPAQRKAAQ